MSLEMKPGIRFQSAVCDTQVAVVKAPGSAIDLRCGGQPMVPIGDERSPDATPEPGHDQGSLIGKRYVDADGSLEVLCTKAGAGTLSVDGAPLELKDAKPLPSSD